MQEECEKYFKVSGAVQVLNEIEDQGIVAERSGCPTLQSFGENPAKEKLVVKFTEKGKVWTLLLSQNQKSNNLC